VVHALQNRNRCGLLVLTLCAKWNPKTGTHLKQCSQGSLPDSCHHSHGHAHMQGNHLVVCALVVQLMLAGVL
jgi:hypothetical protein